MRGEFPPGSAFSGAGADPGRRQNAGTTAIVRDGSIAEVRLSRARPGWATQGVDGRDKGTGDRYGPDRLPGRRQARPQQPWSEGSRLHRHVGAGGAARPLRRPATGGRRAGGGPGAYRGGIGRRIDPDWTEGAWWR